MGRHSVDPVYRHKAWPITRAAILERDAHRCQINGPKCKSIATEVDHIVPTRDGGAWFDPDNLRAACKPCNIGRANRQKAADGWRRSPTRITLVVGPPAGGKSTYVDEHRQPGDMVIDFDRMAEALGSGTTHDHGEGMVAATGVARNALLGRLRRGDMGGVARVWLVSANPKAEQMFPHHDVVVCDPGQQEAEGRALASRPAGFVQLVRQWYADRGSHGGPTVTGPSRRW